MNLNLCWLSIGSCITGTSSDHDGDKEGDANKQFDFYANYQYRVSDILLESKVSAAGMGI